MTATEATAGMLAADPAVVDRGIRLSVECRRTGDWTGAAAWLARSLNAIDVAAGDYRLDNLAARIDHDAVVGSHVAAVDGDQRDPDLIRLPDGTRVCWHLGRTRRQTAWVVERTGERCSFTEGR